MTDITPLSTSRIPKLEPHEFATCIPPHSKEEAEQLYNSIRDNKLQTPIKLFEGKILDGCGRYVACINLEKDRGFEKANFRTEEFIGTRMEALNYVIIANADRRQMNESQRAICAARFVTTTLGGDRRNQSANLQTDNPQITQKDAAERFKISTRLVSDAFKILSDLDLVKAVEEGTKKVSKAAKEFDEKKKSGVAKTKGEAQNPSTNSTADTPTPIAEPSKGAVKQVKTLSEQLIGAVANLNEIDAKEAIDKLIRDLRVIAASKQIELADAA